MVLRTLCRDCLATADRDLARCRACGSRRVLAHVELGALAIAHLDCDAFYASVEKRDRPELRDVPVIVGGGVRGVVTTCCYIARTFGVRSAMPMFKALKACPDATVIRPNFTKYVAESRRIFEKVRALTPLVQTLSLDEAWIDLSGSERLHGGPPALTLARLQREIEADIGLSVSIGLAPNKFLAKIASDLDKPRGFAVIGAAEAETFLRSRPVGILPGVGPAFAKSLASRGYATVGDLAKANPKDLETLFGSGGARLSLLARGVDDRSVDPSEGRKSISAETTFNHDLTSLSDLEDRLWPLCEKVASRARQDELAAGAVVLKLRRPDFTRLTRRRTASEPTQTARTIFAIARELLRAETGTPYRLIGVGLADLEDAGARGESLFPSREERLLASEKAIDRLRSRFGADAVQSGRSLSS